MPIEFQDPSDRKRRLDEAADEYLHAAERGQVPDRQEFLNRYPDLATELAAFIDDLNEFDRLAAPLQAEPNEGSAVVREPPALASGNRVRYFGDYELLNVIGSGGMGVVHKAHQRSLNRPVALKMIRVGSLASEEQVQRFRQEAEAAANLDHPNIVHIYEVGEHNGQHYFSMQFVEGASLDTHIKRRSGERRDDNHARLAREQSASAQLLATTARAVHHAHQHGILHCDLKPANILLDTTGQPHVTDFGLAKWLERDSNLSQSGGVLGTPRYMAPEQAAGQRKNLTIATDVYGLGATLYAMLTGQPPFPDEAELDVLQVLQQVREQPPVKPSVLNPHVNSDLETVCFKCLEKEPQRRYKSAEALAEDLERWLRGEPITARRAGAAERVWRWAKRNRALAIASCTAISAVVATVVILSVSLSIVTHSRNEESKLRRNADRELAFAAMDRGLLLCGQGDVQRGMLWLARSLEHASSDSSDMEWVIRANLSTWHRAISCQGAILQHGDAINAVAFGPDGQTIVTGSQDGIAQLWDTATGARIGEPLRHPGGITQLAFSPDGKTVLTAIWNKTAYVWDVATGRVKPLSLAEEIYGLSFSPDGKIGVVRARDEVRLYDITAGTFLPYRCPAGSAFSPDGKTVVTMNSNKSVQVLDAVTWKPIGQPLQHLNAVTVVAFSPDGQTVLTGSDDKTARLWQASTGLPLGECLQHRSEVRDVAFGPDGKIVLTGIEGFAPDDRFIGGEVQCWEGQLWDAEKCEPIGKPLRHEGRFSLRHAVFAPVGKTLFTGCNSWGSYHPNGIGSARLWETATGKPIGDEFRGTSVKALAFSEDGKTALLTDSFTIQILDAATGKVSGNSLRTQGPVYSAALSPERRAAVTGGFDNKARIWKLAAGRAVGRPLSHDGTVSMVTLSQDGKTALIGGEDTVYLWNAVTSELVGQPLRHQTKVRALAISPDGKIALSGCIDGIARFWDGTTGRPIGTILQHNQPVDTLAFGGNGQIAITGSGGQFRLWDAATSRPIGAPVGDEGSYSMVALSPDGRMIMTGSEKTARFWEVRTGQPIGEPLLHENTVSHIAFSPNSKIALTSTNNPEFRSRETEVRLWKVATGNPIDRSIRPPGRVTAVAFSADSKFLVIGCELRDGPEDRSPKGEARLWDVDTGSPIGLPLEHIRVVDEVAFSADGKTFLTGSGETVHLWHTLTRRPIGSPLQHPSFVNDIYFCCGGEGILTASGQTAWSWTIPAPIEGEVKRIVLWINIITGMELDEEGAVYSLSDETWLKRRQQLEDIGGPPVKSSPGDSPMADDSTRNAD